MRLPALLACALGVALLPAADLLEANRDPAVAPTADFWRHANARWHAAHPWPRTAPPIIRMIGWTTWSGRTCWRCTATC